MKEIAENEPVVIPERTEIDEPDAIWHLGMTPMRIAKGRKQYIFAIIDACTRRVMAIRSYNNATTVSAIDCMNAAIEFNGGKKCRILYTDNGRMFVSKSFEDLLKQKVIFHHKVDKGSPW